MANDAHAKKPIVIEQRREKGRKKTPRLTKTYEVKIISATVGVVLETEKPPQKRVAAYCRVSTDQEAQETSLEEQMAHFNTVIAEHPDWELAGIYADEGISGTQVKNRVQFQQMIEDAKAKKIDLIFTKSISRFARNVVDCLTNIRLLRSLRPPVSVYFDKERLLMEQSWHPESVTVSRKRLELVEIKSYLDEHYTEKIMLDDLAEEFFINKFYLSKIFRETYGTTVNNYLISKRITRAKQLLRFTDMTVDEVGSAVGMADANYFSRMFRKVEGISPREYRKQW